MPSTKNIIRVSEGQITEKNLVHLSAWIMIIFS